MIRYFFTVVFCLVFGFSFGQSVGDYRTRASGNWNNFLTWERFVGAPTNNWVALINGDPTPTSANAIITIVNTHVVNVIAPLTIDQTIVQAGATLNININSQFQFFVIADSPTGTDLTIEGVFQVINSNSRVRINGQIDNNGSFNVALGQVAFNTLGVLGSITNDGTLNVNVGTINVGTGSIVVNGTLEIAGGSLNLTASSLVAVNGEVNYFSGTIAGSTTTNLVFNNGGAYTQNADGTIPIAGWTTGSNCRISGSVGVAPLGLDQNFYDFEWDTPLLGGEIYLDLTDDFNAHNLTFTHTGGNRVFISVSSAATIDLSGDLTYTANSIGVFAYSSDVVINVVGDFNFDSPLVTSTFSTGNVILNVGGSVNFNSGIFDVSGIDDFSSPPTLIPATGTTQISVAGNYTLATTNIINSGAAPSLDLIFDGNGIFLSTFVPTFPINYSTVGTGNISIANGSFLAGTGSLTVNTGTSISLLSTATSGALQDGAVAGNVQNTGSRTYDGTIVYAGAAEQFMSTDHPDEDTRINNLNDVSMLGSVTFTTAVIDLDNGVLKIENNSTLTLENRLNNGGFLGIDIGSNIVVNGTGDFGNLILFNLDGGSGGARMNNLTINRTASGLVTQGTATLNILGTLTLQAGEFHLGSNVTRLFGPLVQGTGFMSSTAFSTLELRGSGAIPADIVITGGAINTLRMDRSGTFNTSSPLVINTLRLAAGDVNNSGNTLSMANGGLINRTFGTLLTPIGNVGTYSVRYGGINLDINPGLEMPALPARAGVLEDLIVDNEFNVTNPNPLPGPNAHTLILNAPIDAAGDFVITQGRVVTGGNAINIGGDLTISNIGSIVPSTSTFTFDGAGPQVVSSVPTLALTNVVVNKTGSTLTLSSPMTISNSFAVNSATVVNIGSGLLTLLSNGTTTAFIPALNAGASIVGSATAQRHLPNTNGSVQYRYIAPIITGSFVSDWKDNFQISGPMADPSPGVPFPGNPSLFYYDETTNTGAATAEARYVIYPPAGVLSTAAPLVNGRGYAAYIRTNAPTLYDNTGGIRQHAVPIPVTRSGLGANDGYNLIGNPYPAPIDWDLVAAASSNVQTAIYLTDNTLNANGIDRKIVYMGAGVSVPPTAFDGNIAQGQGFWVRATAATGTVSFAEAHKVSGQAEFLREGEAANLLYIKMQRNTTIEYTAIRLHEEATDEYDGRWDAYQFGGTGLYISSLTKDNKKVIFNSISSIGCDNTVPLQIDGGVTGNYTFDFTGIETFEPGATLYLNDKVLNKQVTLSTTPQYAFTVTDVTTLKNRFEIFIDRPSVETALAVAGESVCENNELAYITVQNSQANVNYSAQWNGQTLSSEIMGNGGQLQIPIPVENLTQGDHQFTILAKMTNCDAVPLENKATLTVVKKGVIERVEEGSACEEGQVVIKAVSDGTELYNWYEDVSSTSPIAGQNAATFTTEVLNKTKTYYVAAVNSMGCEGERVPVKANVTLLEDVVIIAEGTTLTSSYENGNQWYLDGLVIDNATTNQIEATLTGTYSVVATVGGCTTSAAREMVVTGIGESQADFITIYPNPATDKVLVQVKSVKPSLQAKLMSPIGVELNTMALKGESEIKSGEFDLRAYPTGMYMVRIIDGKKIYTIKISKVK